LVGSGLVRDQCNLGNTLKYTTVKISQIAAHPTMRLDPGYWLRKKKIRALRPSRKQQAASVKSI
jgi:hypothetical protein